MVPTQVGTMAVELIIHDAMSFQRLRFPIALFVCTFGLFMLAAPTVRAFTVSPVIVDLDVAPGKSSQGSIHITNNAENSQTFYVGIQTFVARGEEGQQDFLPEDNKIGLPSWITPASRSVTLGPNESKDFTYVVNVPKDAEAGGHYAALFFSTQPMTEQGDVSVGVGAKTGVLFLLAVPGDIKEDARIESFTVNAGTFDRLPAYFDTRIRNLGNIHFRPEGNIVVKSMFGTTSARFPMNPLNAAVLPNSIRRVQTVWAVKTFDSDTGKGTFFGRYTAELDATYGTSKQPLHGQVTFWVFPWRLAIVGGVLLVVLILLLMGYNRMVVRVAMKKTGTRK